MRLKLVCILGALVFLLMYMCSCVGKVEAQNQSKDFDVRRVYYDDYNLTIYKEKIIILYKI